ncbi:hypothetical protein CI238_02977, partial [Colletotrichum incanum]
LAVSTFSRLHRVPPSSFSTRHRLEIYTHNVGSSSKPAEAARSANPVWHLQEYLAADCAENRRRRARSRRTQARPGDVAATVRGPQVLPPDQWGLDGADSQGRHARPNDKLRGPEEGSRRPCQAVQGQAGRVGKVEEEEQCSGCPELRG